jgi:hypothetical protein
MYRIREEFFRKSAFLNGRGVWSGWIGVQSIARARTSYARV